MTALVARARASSVFDRASLNHVVAFAIAAALLLGLNTVAAPTNQLAFVVQTVGLATCAWLFYTARIGWSLAVLFLYLGLLDGYLKLRIGTDSVTAGRNLLLFAIAAGAAVRLLRGQRRVSLPPLTFIVILFVAVSLVQILNPASPGGLRAVLAVRPLIEFTPLFFLGYATMTSSRPLERFLMLLVVITGVNGVVGYIQTLLTPEQLASWGPGYADLILGGGNFEGGARIFADETGTSRVRPPALGSDLGFGGALGVAALPASLALLAQTKDRRTQACALVGVAGVAVAVLTAQARLPLVAAVVSGLIYLVFTAASRQRATAIVATALAIATVGLAGKLLVDAATTNVLDRYRTVTPDQLFAAGVEERGGPYVELPRLISDIPLGGGLAQAGPALKLRTKEERANYNAESGFNFFLIETGILGLVLLLAIAFTAMKRGVLGLRHIQSLDERRYLAAVIAGLAGYLVAFLGAATFSGTPGAAFLWFSLGLIVRITHLPSHPDR